MKVKDFREKINLSLYDSKQSVLLNLRILSFFISIILIGILTYKFGFSINENTDKIINIIIQFSFGFYISYYFTRLIYDFNPLRFIKKTWFEFSLVIMLLIEGVYYNLFDKLIIITIFDHIGIIECKNLHLIIFQFYLLILVGIDLGKRAVTKPKLRIHPAKIFIFSFLILIFIGTILLMMPELVQTKESMNFLDALFTSTSATCVTGLSVVDTANFFTFKGQFVIMFLIQLGGINIIAFGASLGLFARLGLGMSNHYVIEDLVFKDTIFKSKGLLKQIIISSLLIELLGSILILWVSYGNLPFLHGIDEYIFFSIFHSISAFNNAGFSNIPNGLYNEIAQYMFMLQIILAGLIFIGALGFDTFFDLFGIKKLRDRLMNPWKKPKLGSILNLYTSIYSIIIVSVIFLYFEWENTLGKLNSVDKIITSVFQVISSRSAGFNSIDFHKVNLPLLIVLIILMFIGGGSSSSAGGIKTSTFSILILSAIAIITGKNRIEISNRIIPQDIIIRAFAITLFALTGIFFGILILSISEYKILLDPSRSLVDLIFEQVSAFSTVGISTGITSSLSIVGKYTIITSMIVGRIGILTIAFALINKLKSINYKYPEEHILIG